jgi:hypothetical protein
MTCVDAYCEVHLEVQKLLGFHEQLKSVFAEDKSVEDAFVSAVLHLAVLRDKLECHPQKQEDIRMAKWKKDHK